MEWIDLPFWDTPEAKTAMEKIDGLRLRGIGVNPRPDLIFAAMDATPFSKVRVCLFGQDPYPDPEMATGMAFSIPKTVPPKKFPPTLKNLFQEYHSDLGLPEPTVGSLTKWTSQGVFLWNVLPTCNSFQSLSHDWPEWRKLTREIIVEQSKTRKVMVFLGGVARQFTQYVDDRCVILEYSHPSPRASAASRTPFKSSRMFSTINAHLNAKKLGSIDWRLS